MRHAKAILACAILVLGARHAQLLSASANTDLEQKVEPLLAQMTLDEKVGQMVQFNGINERYRALIRQGRVGSLLNVRGAKAVNEVQRLAVEESRLKIPLIFGFDVIHGYRTIFPIPLGEAASWDPELVQKAAAVAAKEAAAVGLHWTFAPMVDIARDPRWGRIAEGSGEDPLLGSIMAAARVRGFQGAGLGSPHTVVACAKHYVGYGGAEAGRDYNSVDMSEKTLREIYLPPFKAAVDAGVGTLMSAFNDLNGIPTSANRFTLTQVLRTEWGFKGFVVSDWNSIGELVNHGFAADLADAGRQAAEAGVDMDMEGNSYVNHLAQLVKQGKVSEETVNRAVRGILRIKFSIGLFDQPYVDPGLEATTLLSPEHREAALQMARESIVLLKNQKDLLPLPKNTKTLALIGPLADDRDAPLGPWSGDGRPQDVVTVLAGLKSRLSSETKILYAKGAEVTGESTQGIAEAVGVAKQAEVAVLVLGERADMSGEAASRAFLDLPGVQNELIKAVFETGVPTVLVLMNGRPLTISWAADHIRAILETWFLGVETGHAIADVLLGDYNPAGRLPVTFPRTVGQVPLFYSHKNTGRPPTNARFTSRYLDVPVTPLFPFGWGLSYTRFQYGDLRLSSKQMGVSGQIEVSVRVTNAGSRAGCEVVQLYVRDLLGSTTRPVKELKDFRRVSLAPGESRQIAFSLKAEQLAFHSQEMKPIVEPGAFKLWVGGSSVEGLEADFEVTP